MNTKDRLATFRALGVRNLWRVGLYRVFLKLGVHPSQRLKAAAPVGPFFHGSNAGNTAALEIRNDWQAASGHYQLFGRESETLHDFQQAPDWFLSPYTQRKANSQDPWWTIGDFSESVGDIKTVWELSRFDWLLAFSQQAASGDAESLQRLETWLSDWCARNVPYRGVNWKCGQEASIRVMHLSAALLVLQESDMTSGLRQLVQLHLRRIAPTIQYAVGQANNHGTSEAAALFIGGALLGGSQGKRWEQQGRRWLEDRGKTLIESDGTFSQYSVNYHRVMLDTYCLVEIYRRKLDKAEFSAALQAQLQAATTWLDQMTDSQTGEAPNMGANDGAQLIKLSQCDYRDFRPSVQLATALFHDARRYEQGPWDQQLQWLGVPLPETLARAPSSCTFAKGGLMVLRQHEAVAYLRFPRFRFRPSQADALHCDFWLRGQNILLDAGTYSYNARADDTAYFNGTRAHNTVEFDERDQMPRMGRFLFGNWLDSHSVEPVSEVDGCAMTAAAYTDDQGATHHRRMELRENELLVTDTLSGFHDKAVLRWRLGKGQWQLSDRTLAGESVTISIESDVSHCDMRMESSWASDYYLEKFSVPVLAVEYRQAATVTTRISF